MTTSTVTLSAFLLARIAEDEAVAREFDWAKPHQYEVPSMEASPEYVTIYVPPARVLAECEAKRRIVERASYWIQPVEGLDGEDILRLLALPYADHPDFRQEWRA